MFIALLQIIAVITLAGINAAFIITTVAKCYNVGYSDGERSDNRIMFAGSVVMFIACLAYVLYAF